jgi:hypothetical protein
MSLTHVICDLHFSGFLSPGETIMASDDLFTRADRAIRQNRTLRSERLLLEQRFSDMRSALRSAVIEMATLRADIRADRGRSSLRRSEPNSTDCADIEDLDIQRLECMRDYVRSQQEALRMLRQKMLN